MVGPAERYAVPSGSRPSASARRWCASIRRTGSCIAGRRSARPSGRVRAPASLKRATRCPCSGSTSCSRGRARSSSSRSWAPRRWGGLDAFRRARVDLLRGQITLTQGLAGDAAPLLLAAAKRLEELDLGLARETYLSVCAAAMFGGPLSGDDLIAAGRARARDTVRAHRRRDPARPTAQRQRARRAALTTTHQPNQQIGPSQRRPDQVVSPLALSRGCDTPARLPSS